MDLLLIEDFRKNLGVDPRDFLDVTGYINDGPEAGKRGKSHLVRFIIDSCRCEQFCFPDKLYKIEDSCGEEVGYVCVGESISLIKDRERVVGCMHEVEVLNEFADLVTSREFIKDPAKWHERLQMTYRLFDGAGSSQQEHYESKLGVFVDQDFLFDIINGTYQPDPRKLLKYVGIL